MPTINDILPILQALSAMAIAGTFLFTAVQFRNYRRAAHVANFTKMVELQMHLREMRVNDPDLAGVYRHDVRDLMSDREIREYFFNLMQLSVYEIVWFSYHAGQLPQDYYRSWEQRMKDIASEPSFRKMLKSPGMKIMHDDFQKYIMKVVNETPERP
jgi:hypothetical protein